MRKIFPAFLAGQALQLILHAASLTYFPAEQILLCGFAGGMIAVAFLIGVGVANRETRATEEEIAPPSIVDASWSPLPLFGERVHED